MLNEVTLVGRLAKDPEVIENSGKKRAFVILAVPRNFKNVDGVYDTDFLRVTLWNAIALNTKEYCKKGDLIAIKGRLQTSSYVDSEDNKKYTLDIIGESISFLATKRETNEEE